MAKTNYNISRQLQRDLMAAYIDVTRGPCWSQREAYEKTARHPAPRYYISPKQAHQVISRMVKGDFELVDMMQQNRRRMYYALFDEVVRLMEKREYIGKSLSHIMKFAVIQPAPEFFIGWDHVKRIRSWLKGGMFNDDGSVKVEKVGFYRKYHERRGLWTSEKTS